MPDRRQNMRDIATYDGVAGTDEHAEFSNVIHLPRKRISPTTTPKDRSFLAKIIWWRDSFVGLAFSSETSSGLPVSDLGERVRKSEAKKRQLQRRIKQLLDAG